MIEIKNSNFSVSPALEKAWEKSFQQKEARFFELPSRSPLWADSINRSLEIQKVADVTCVIGIGGSSLGGRALEQAFDHLSPHRIFFFEAPDETMILKARKKLGPLNRVHFIFISKSGKTLETLSLLDYFAQVLREQKLEISKQSTVICGAASSPLRDWAVRHQVPILPVPEDVGGRFSVLTPVGLLPAALMGVPMERLRAGAEWALSQKNLVLQLSAASLKSFEEKRWITQMWIYSEHFHTLGLWWQQLWSESLGKKEGRSGKPAPRVSTPMVCLGPQDQHSLLQQLQEAERDKSIIVFRDSAVEKKGMAFECHVMRKLEESCQTIHLGEILAAEADGFQGALNEAGIPFIEMRGDSTKLECWGAFFMVWELVIAVLGEALEINAFDQPGVELGKRLAMQSLRERF
jgi:glucose-6-phosphate isomerase